MIVKNNRPSNTNKNLVKYSFTLFQEIVILDWRGEKGIISILFCFFNYGSFFVNDPLPKTRKPEKECIQDPYLLNTRKITVLKKT